MKRSLSLLFAFTVACSDGDSIGSRDLAEDTAPPTDASEVDASAEVDGVDLTDLIDALDVPADVEAIDDAFPEVSDLVDVPPDDVPTLEDITDPPDTSDVSPPFECPWTRWDDGLNGGRIGAVHFDPRTPGLAWTSSGGTLFRSVDAGVTWLEWTSPAPTGKLAFPPDDPKELIGIGTGLSVSYDSGRTFEPLSLAGIEIVSVLIDPAVSQRLWVGTANLGILRSDNRGRTFFPRNNGVPPSRIASLAGFPDAPEVTLVGTVGLNENLGITNRGMILRTTNAGQTWQQVVTDAAWVSNMATCPAQPGLVYAAVRNGARRSTDYGQTWAPIPALAGLDVWDLALSADCSVVWASVYQRGIYRLTDGGATIEGPMTAGLDLQLTFLGGDLAVHPSDPRVLLMGTHSGLYRSADGGFSWRRAPAARSLQIHRLRSSPARPDRLYLATWGGGLWLKDGESAWRRSAAPNADFLTTVAVSQSAPGRVLVGAAGTNWLGADAMQSFVSSVPGSNAQDAHFFEDGRVLMSTQVLGLRLSEDNGLTWLPANGGLVPWPTTNGTFIDTRAIAVDPHDEDRIFVGTRGRGVIISTDGAETWSFVDNELADEVVGRLVVRRNSELELFAGVSGRGIFRSLDGASTWQEVGAGLPSADLTDFIEDEETGTLYVSLLFGPVMHSVDGAASWRPFTSYCGGAEDVAGLAIVEVDGERWLVAVKGGNVVLRHRLGLP